jgi:hypothetical protein
MAYILLAIATSRLIVFAENCALGGIARASRAESVQTY